MDSIDPSTEQRHDDSVDLTVDLSELTHEQLRAEKARILEELAHYHPTSAAPRGK